MKGNWARRLRSYPNQHQLPGAGVRVWQTTSGDVGHRGTTAAGADQKELSHVAPVSVTSRRACPRAHPTYSEVLRRSPIGEWSIATARSDARRDRKISELALRPRPRSD